MALHSYHVDEETLKSMQGLCTKVDKKLPGNAQGRGHIVVFPQLTQQDLLRLSSVAFSGYVELGSDIDSIYRSVSNVLKSKAHTIAVSLSTRTLAAINSAHVLVAQFEMNVALTDKARSNLTTGLHEAILRGIIANLELWEWNGILSDLPLFFDMFYRRISDPGYGNRRMTIILDGNSKEVGFTVAVDATAGVMPASDEKRTLIESLADKVLVSQQGQIIAALFSNQ